MIKDIKFSGYTTVPSDYESPDGALAASIDIIAEDNQLKPLFQPSVKVALPDGCEVMALHKTNDYTHYIVRDRNRDLYWMDDQEGGLTRDGERKLGVCHEVTRVEAIGNTLILLTPDAILYYLWKEHTYSAIGDHIPDIGMSFGLKGKAKFYSLANGGVFSITFDPIFPQFMNADLTEANQEKITAQVMAKVNKFLRQQSVDKGRFAMPFFVRYALRLYDGTLTAHSAPILMNPATKAAPLVFCYAISGEGGTLTNATCDIMLVSCSLDCQMIPDAANEHKRLTTDWTDIVKSVDIFISAPIYTYDQSGKCKRFFDTGKTDTKFIGALDMGLTTAAAPDDGKIRCPVVLGDTTYNQDIDDTPDFLKQTYTEWPYSKLYAICVDNNRTFPETTIALPAFSDEKASENIRNVCDFYLLKSIPVEELSTQRTDIHIDDDYLQSLVCREKMTDDYLSHDTLAADFSHVYNSRLNLAGIRRTLFRGFQPSAMFAYKNRDTVRWSQHYNTICIDAPESQCATQSLYTTVYIKENNRTYAVQTGDNTFLTSFFMSRKVYPTQEDLQSGTNGTYCASSWGCYLFYPNPNAFKMVVRDFRGSYTVELRPHDFLNGAYAFIGYDTVRTGVCEDLPAVTDDTGTVRVPNKIYTSEVNNPFYFPVLGINTVGAGTILGMSSATKALSQGQFGQFPLYAFTTEGVWALEVSATGSYSAKQPVTRDVCINPKSITQLDSAVLFATDRGIMLLTGSQADCITDAINAEQPFNVLTLPHMDELHLALGHDADTCFPTRPFLTFLRNCAMIYDYMHQHIIVYNPAYTYAYVYSMRSREWGMMHSNIASGVNSYPDALAMTNDNKLVSFNDTDETVAKGLYVTRPIKLETPDVLKTIDVVIQRGMFQRGDVQTVLYGSRDLYNWFVVWSSKDHFLRGFRGTPYKYYRIAGIATLTPDKSVFGASIQYTPKYLNQPR